MSVHLSAPQEQHDPNMAVGDFKQHLYSQLKAAGVMSSLKVCNHQLIACKCGDEIADVKCTSLWQLQTQLRSQVLSKLQGQQCSIHAAVPSSDTIWRSLMNSLVVDYLTACHYHYTLSVFQPEAGVSGLKTLKHKDILQLMHIEGGSPLQAALSRRGAFTEGMSLHLCLHTARLLCIHSLRCTQTYIPRKATLSANLESRWSTVSCAGTPVCTWKLVNFLCQVDKLNRLLQSACCSQ